MQQTLALNFRHYISIVPTVSDLGNHHQATMHLTQYLFKPGHRLSQLLNNWKKKMTNGIMHKLEYSYHNTVVQAQQRPSVNTGLNKQLGRSLTFRFQKCI